MTTKDSYCASCDQLRDLLDKVTDENKRLIRENKSLSKSDLGRQIIQLQKDKEILERTVKEMGGAREAQPIEKALPAMARVIRKLMRNHKSERTSDRIAESDRQVIESLAER